MTKSESDLLKRLLVNKSGLMHVQIMAYDAKAIFALDRAGLVQIVRDSTGVRWARLLTTGEIEL